MVTSLPWKNLREVFCRLRYRNSVGKNRKLSTSTSCLPHSHKNTFNLHVVKYIVACVVLCYIIFICPFDLFGQGRHIYTFENYCKEDKNILLGDDAVKIFLNADGKLDDVSKELRAFLDYVAGK